MTGPTLAVSAIAVQRDRLLMVRRGHGPAAGSWSVPGGKVQVGEMLAEAVVREVLEETGLEVVCDGIVGIRERITDDDHHVIVSHGVTVFDPDAELLAGDDAAEASWVPMHAVIDLNLVDGLAEFLHEHGVLEAIV